MNRKELQQMNYEKKHKEIDGVLYKHCSIHDEYFPNEDNEWFPCTDEYFYKNKSSPDGLYPYCKRCNVQKSTKYIKEHLEHHKAYDKQNNKKPHMKKKIKEYSQKFRDNGYYKNWQQNNSDKIKEYNEYRDMNKKHTISTKEWTSCKKYFNNECAYCGLPINKHYNTYNGEVRLTDFHREHVDHNGANDLSNCVPSCKTCNSSKRKLIFEEWYTKQEFYKDERLNKIYQWLTEDYKLYIKENNKNEN